MQVRNQRDVLPTKHVNVKDCVKIYIDEIICHGDSVPRKGGSAAGVGLTVSGMLKAPQRRCKENTTLEGKTIECGYV